MDDNTSLVVESLTYESESKSESLSDKSESKSESPTGESESKSESPKNRTRVGLESESRVRVLQVCWVSELRYLGKFLFHRANLTVCRNPFTSIRGE